MQTLASLMAKYAWELSRLDKAAPDRMRRKPFVITACYAQAARWT